MPYSKNLAAVRVVGLDTINNPPRSIGANREKGVWGRKNKTSMKIITAACERAAKDTERDVNKTGRDVKWHPVGVSVMIQSQGRRTRGAAQTRSPLLWAVALRADVLFGVEQPNEQQAGVRNVAPAALPSDYHTKTHLCVCACEKDTRAHSPVQRGNTARTSLAQREDARADSRRKKAFQ